jgi:hypothetical protein
MTNVPLIITHGTNDEVIGFNYASVVDGSPFQAVVDTGRAMVQKRGCPAEGTELSEPFFKAQGIECRDYCGGVAAGARDGAAAEAPAPAANAANSGARNAGESVPKESSSSSTASSKKQKSRRDLLQRGIGEAAANAAANAPFARAAAAGRNGAGLSVGDPYAVNAPGARSGLGQVMKNAPEPVDGRGGTAGGLPAGGRNGDGGATMAAAGARDGAGVAPVRFCSVPGGKHNLYEVVRSFPIDVSAAWFAKHAGGSWGPTPPS